MTIPQISESTILATISKMRTQSPNDFTRESLIKMSEEGNEDLAGALASMGLVFMQEAEQAIESGMSADHLMAGTSEIMMAYSMLVYRIMSAQIEADELNEAWA
tara:strand:+ start:1036 stop:1347 length:312 start_codon:yes stop_codon:yes gene_type:complete